jgi:CBS domain-containing protein
MRVQEVMTHDPICCTQKDDIGSAAAVMTDCNISMVPVTEQHYHPSRFLGVITQHDLCALVAEGKEPFGTRIEECISASAPVCLPTDDVAEALHAMRISGLLRIPVLNPKGELLGTISAGDIIRHHAAESSELFKTLSVIAISEGPGKMPLKKIKSSTSDKGFSAAS